MASLIRYDARFNSLCDQIKQLTSTIENTQEVLELTLDNERNRIARLELLLNMAGISLGACSAIGGFFGMNVVNGVENLPGIFAIVTGSDSHSALHIQLHLCMLLNMCVCVLQELGSVLSSIDAHARGRLVWSDTTAVHSTSLRKDTNLEMRDKYADDP